MGFEFDHPFHSINVKFRRLGSSKYELRVYTRGDTRNMNPYIEGPQLWLRFNSNEISDIINTIDHGLAEMNKEKKTNYGCKFLHIADCSISKDRELALLVIASRPPGGHEFIFSLRGKDEVKLFQENLKILLNSQIVDY